jgi:hypothetical protein
MKNSEKPFISIASAKDGPACSCKFGVNNAATVGKLDADLTQTVSPSVRRQLLHLSSVYQG